MTRGERSGQPLEAFLVRMPKVELHVHLEGSIRPGTLLQLARRHGVGLPAEDEAGLREWFRFRDFEHFVQIYLTVSRCLRDPEDFYNLALDFLAEQARQSILYTEAHFTIATHVVNGVDPEATAQALEAARQEARKRFGVELRLIPDIVRNVGEEAGDVTLEWALANRHRGVVAMGLSGSEDRFPNEPFREHFARAEREGLHRVAHAGEHAGPDSVRSALEVARAERIGHGVRAIDDPALVEELVRRRIPIEVCPTSNLCLKVYPRMEDHPFDRLREAGVRVSVNSDDPPFFNTTLTEEYTALHQTFGYDASRLAGLSLAGLHHAFLDDAERADLEHRFRQGFHDLGQELLGEPVDPTLPPGETTPEPDES